MKLREEKGKNFFFFFFLRKKTNIINILQV